MKVGVILSGCGVFDGSEIHEAVITLLCLDQAGVAYECAAPNIEQMHVIDHLAGQPVAGESRNVLVEAARIARGDIRDLAEVNGGDYDAIILPGGFGAAKNLCTFATDGPACAVNPDVERVLTEANNAGKPIGFICIAPALAATIFGESLKPTLTIGHDESTAAAIESLGARHEARNVDEVTVDQANKIVSTAAYMEAKSIREAYAGISKLVNKVIELAG